MLSKSEFNRIYLNCRRGMLELDIILLTYLENEYFLFDSDIQKQFEYLLSSSDQDLYNWLVKGIVCEDSYLNEIILKIRFVVSRFKFN